MGVAPAARSAFAPDTRVHRDAEIEWWYVFATLDRRHTLMACVWRYQALGLPEGLMACYALTDVAGDARRRGTWIDRPMLELSREILASSLEPDLFTEGVLELTADGASFSPYRLAERSRLVSSAESVTASVGPCRARHDLARDELRLEIADRDLAIDLRLDLDATCFPMNGTGEFEIAGKWMRGYTYPQAPAAGRIALAGATRETRGRAWLDHQWGDWAFDRPNAAFSHPEWHYFAVPFDDGASLVVSLEKRGDERHLVYGCWCAADGTLTRLTHVRVESRDHFQSLRTRNLYEYGWRIELPEIDASLELEPYHPDHEVLTFTRERGFLELGVRVTGRLFGRACQADGFVESFGEPIDLHRAFWETRPHATTRQIEKFLPRRATPEWLRRLTGSSEPLAVDAALIDRALVGPIWSMVDRGGKAWRSAWFALCCHALEWDGSDERLRELMPVVELIHTGSLIVDDVEDESPVRRGVPALHELIGQDLAINVGNFLYFLPMMLIQDLEWLTDAQRLEAYQRIAVAQRQGHVGQALDLMWSKGRTPVRATLDDWEGTRDALLEAYRLKCGCQLEAAARIAGSLAAADASWIDALSHWSRAFGIVYQIVDDLKDVAEDSRDLGKPTFEDLRNGRLNLVLLHALAGADPARREPLIAALERRAAPAPVEFMRELIAETRAVERCLDLAERVMAEAEASWRALPPTDAKIALRTIPRFLIDDRRRRTRDGR